ncbi:MAG: putative solute-binding protein [Gammaproteobacteria bacterium]
MAFSSVRLSLPLLAFASLLSFSATAASTTVTQRICVFDPVGTQGEAFNLMKDFRLTAAKWGVSLELKAYTDERVAAEDFKAGQCDGAIITGLRGRQFNTFTGSIDSVGAIPTYQHMRTVVELLSSPKSASLMVSGPYEIAGIVPLGAAYVFVNDRKIDSIEKAAGKKIAVLEWDKSQARMVQQLGAQPVASDITNFAGKFNNGQVDIIASPAVAFKPLELYKGLGTKGAVYRFPLVQISANLVIRQDKFPAGFGQRCREYIATQLDRAFDMIRKSEADIEERYWMDISAADKVNYTKLMREARLQLTREGVYDRRTMSLLKRVRCKYEPGAAECALKDE